MAWASSGGPHGLPTTAAATATPLPSPRASNPVFQPSRMEARQQLILARFYGRDVTIPPVEEDTLTIPPITVPEVPPVIDSLLKDTILDTVRDTTRDTTRMRRDSLRDSTKKDSTKRDSTSRPI